MYFYLQNSELLSGKAFNSIFDILHVDVRNVSCIFISISWLLAIATIGINLSKNITPQIIVILRFIAVTSDRFTYSAF